MEYDRTNQKNFIYILALFLLHWQATKHLILSLEQPLEQAGEM